MFIDRRRFRIIHCTMLAIAAGVIWPGGKASGEESLFAQAQTNPQQPGTNPVRQVNHSEPTRLTGGEASLPLPGAPRADGQKTSGGSHTLEALFSVALSLGAVLGLFFLAAWIMRRGLPSSATAKLPTEVVDVLGRASLGGRQQLQLLRLGNKLLLVSLSANGVSTLGEVTDATEVDRLAGLCRKGNPAGLSSIAKNLRQSLRAVGGEGGDA